MPGCLDPTHDTPVEVLHTVLLGVVKYAWHWTHTSWTPAQKIIYAQRLQATSVTGLSVHAIRASYIIQYAKAICRTLRHQFSVLRPCSHKALRPQIQNASPQARSTGSSPRQNLALCPCIPVPWTYSQCQALGAAYVHHRPYEAPEDFRRIPFEWKIGVVRTQSFDYTYPEVSWTLSCGFLQLIASLDDRLAPTPTAQCTWQDSNCRRLITIELRQREIVLTHASGPGIANPLLRLSVTTSSWWALLILTMSSKSIVYRNTQIVTPFLRQILSLLGRALEPRPSNSHYSETHGGVARQPPTHLGRCR
ncbi:hypothetical protein NUW54_g114 [Trametes sanguinea]|uniref:Uncharacterized protein n=1 Tax=Trametes sanguinea TaxID=158606 RepID=A0ACC1QBZ2_9APHY|nr:hypothetical protein NUW54_g114 [Trametes sanguinea]